MAIHMTMERLMTIAMELVILVEVSTKKFLKKFHNITNRLLKILTYPSLPSLVLLPLTITNTMNQVYTLQSHLQFMMTSINTQTSNQSNQQMKLTKFKTAFYKRVMDKRPMENIAMDRRALDKRITCNKKQIWKK